MALILFRRGVLLFYTHFNFCISFYGGKKCFLAPHVIFFLQYHWWPLETLVCRQSSSSIVSSSYNTSMISPCLLLARREASPLMARGRSSSCNLWVTQTRVSPLFPVHRYPIWPFTFPAEAESMWADYTHDCEANGRAAAAAALSNALH